MLFKLWKRGNQMNWDKLVDMISNFRLFYEYWLCCRMAFVTVFDQFGLCLNWKWTTSHSLPISSSSCSSWHVHSFEMALWKVKKWDMFIHSVVWVPASSTWLSWGKLWKQEGFVIKFLWFAICYVFVYAGLTGRRSGRPSLCSALYCTAILEEELEKVKWRKGREKAERRRQIHNQQTPNPVWANLRSFAHSGWRERWQAMQSQLLCFLL